MKKKTATLLIALCVMFLALPLVSSAKTTRQKKTVYVAWSNIQTSNSFTSTLCAIKAMGAEPVVLDQALSADLAYDHNNMLVDAKDEHGILTSGAAKRVKINTWSGSNVEKMMKNVDCVVFPGGSDICPTLYYNEQQWHGISEDANYSAERDVSDYILLSYCLDRDIPVLCICRGMQMLSVVSGADMIQDLPQWFEEQGIKTSFLHRDPEKRSFIAHPVKIPSAESLIYRIMHVDSIEGVPSWHHQAIKGVDNTRLVVTAYTETDGKQIIEAVERPDKTFCLGIQFHPEVAVRKWINKEADAENYMKYDDAIALFRSLLCREKK